MANKINEINTARILQLLWYSKGISRVDMARELGLGKSTVTNIVNSLMRRDLVRLVESGQSGPNGGRRPLVLAINARYGYILGLEIQTEFFKAVATDLQGEVIFSYSKAMPFADEGIAAIFSEVMRTIKPKLRAIGLPLIGVGLGVAGIIDPNDGLIVQSNPLGIERRTRFYDEIAGLLDVPVMIENDANCCCWGELAFRKTERHGSFVFVLGEFRKGRTSGQDYWGVAVGMGLVLDGKVRHGDGFSTGEFQSILWEEGNSGQFSLSDAESRRVKDDPAVRSKVIRELCIHVAFLVNTLNLACVVIGGEMAKYREEIVEVLRVEIRRNWSYSNEVACAIEFAALGEMAVAYGASGMFLERFFSIPEAVDSGDQGAAARISIAGQGLRP
jgi:predicted NBD/HSP70 family sugar kinase